MSEDFNCEKINIEENQPVIEEKRQQCYKCNKSSVETKIQ